MVEKSIDTSQDEKSFIDKWGFIIQWLIPAFVVLLWILSTFSNNYKLKLLPSPYQVIIRAIQMIGDGTIWQYIAISTQRALFGLLFGATLGYLLGMINGMSKVLNAILNTTIQMFRTVPILGLMPVLIIYLGIGEEFKVFVVALGVFFSMYLNTYGGVKTIDKKLIEMSKVYGFNKWQLFINVIFPGSLQSVLVGFRMSLGGMWMMLIAAEMVGTDSGLGYMASQARELMQMDIVFLSLFIYAFLGKLSDVIATLLEKRFLRWRHG